jgi:hypothetical protein
MSGRHESSNKRSYYLSVTTSVFRFVIIAALLVGGVVVVNSAFPESGTGGGIPEGGVVAPTGATGATGSPGATGGTGGQTQAPDVAEPEVVGMNVAVRNGTSVSGLAGSTAGKLEKKFGVNAIQVDDAPSPVSVTTIYYRNPDQQDEAEYLAQRFFKKIEPMIAELEAGSGVDKDVALAIYLGTDYASAA